MRLVRRRSVAGLLAVGAVALIAGCGNGDDQLSADEYRQQADAVCADANRELEGLDEPTSEDELLPYIDSGLSIQGSQLERLRDLDPPDDLRPAHDRAMDLLQQRQDRIERAVEEIRGGADAEQAIEEADEEVERLQDEARGAARELGLEVCGTDPDDTGTDTTGTETEAPGQVGTPQQFAQDTLEAAGNLQEFGQLLQGLQSVEDLRANIDEARESLDSFDAAIAELDGYRLDDADLEARRTGLAETGPNVSDVLRRFIDAAAANDADAVNRLVPEVQQAITEFQRAATGAGSP